MSHSINRLGLMAVIGIILYCGFIHLADTSFAGDDQQTQPVEEKRFEPCASYGKNEKRMHEILKQITIEYADDTLFLEKLDESQQAWEKYLWAHIKALYPEEDTRYHYGSVYSLCLCINLDSKIQSRIEELQLWLDKVEEGEVCSGSVKFK